MRITTQNTLGPQQDHSVSLAWTADEDPRGYLARLIESGRLADVLAAVADTMEFGSTDLLAGRADAADRLRGSVELLDLLFDRIARLTVALRNEYETDWADLARMLDPNADSARLSTALHVYLAGRRAMGVPLADEN